jgi:CMP-N-acetylneuraminic acid synthetase
MKIIIPARKDSKGFPFKNRKLFKYTADIIPDVMKHKTYVVTDDEDIKLMALEAGFTALHRPDGLSQDETSTKTVIRYTLEKLNIKEETIIMLYLTYPERTWNDVINAINAFKVNDINSLLCKKPIEVSPFLMLKSEPGNRGSQLFYHDLYRRQDYPNCFEISHFISMFNSSELDSLNNNLYNNDTYFMEISNDVLDVDYEKDFNRLNENNKR